uniref:Uncharacterized protein n=1 Tax=Aegilops tauschii subsp. strangulata TaxID=200361 RepID=A0A453PB43_AEGTS
PKISLLSSLPPGNSPAFLIPRQATASISLPTSLQSPKQSSPPSDFPPISAAPLSPISHQPLRHLPCQTLAGDCCRTDGGRRRRRELEPALPRE